MASSCNNHAIPPCRAHVLCVAVLKYREDHRAGALTRRQLLTQSAVTSVAFGAAALHSPSLTFATTSPLVEKPPSHDCIIEAPWGLVFQAGRLKLLPDCSVRIRKDRIEEVKSGTLPGNTPRLRATGQLLLPGFISGHTHACSATPTRGIIEGGRSYARPLELVEKLSPEDLDDLTAYNVAELLRSGCTTHVEMSLSLRQAESYVRIAKRWGVRGYPGGMIPGIARLFPIWFRNSDQVLTDSEQETLAEVASEPTFCAGPQWRRGRTDSAPHGAARHRHAYTKDDERHPGSGPGNRQWYSYSPVTKRARNTNSPAFVG